jgi:small subunit ribosomal protein S2
MGPFIFGSRNNIHIIDLAQTVPLLHQALVTVSDTVAKGGRVLFVGTKRQASDIISESARQCAQYFINHRWLGGTLTNWQTISKSIKRLRELEELLEGEAQGLTKKELLQLTREHNKIDRALGGIKEIGGVPDLLFVIDTNKEAIAIAEARKLKIPVIAIVDTNCDPDLITYPIPGNDDAGRAITLYCDLISRAAIDGIERAQGSAGIDVGESEKPAIEEVLIASETKEAEPEKAKSEDKAGDEKKDDKKPAAEKAAEKADEKKADDKEAKTKKDDAKPADSEKDTKPAKKAEGFERLKKADGEADDLKKLTGVGPVLEKTLNEFGIYHYRQIAGLKKAEIAEIDEALNFKGRIERDEWIKQAKELAKSGG